MIQIENVNKDNYSLVYNFLKTVPSINEIEDDILNNGSIVFDDNKIIGSIAYEEYDHIGLIRYFVFKKNLSADILEELMSTLENNAKNKDVEKLICVADSGEIENLFATMGFEQITKKIYLNEDKISATAYAKSKFLFKKISG